MSTNEKRPIRPTDWVVLILMTSALIFSLTIVLIGKPSVSWLEGNSFLLTCFAALICISLAAWMLDGGVQSTLWGWLPPFCMFPKVKWIRWVVVVGIILGTIMGIVEAKRNPTPVPIGK